jgi:3-oxoacyl-[acyl-carrier-protein] synthase II
MGIISSIGDDVQENHSSLLQSKAGIRKVEHIKTILRDSIMVAEVKHTNDELIKKLNLPSDNNFSRTTMLGLHAAKEAVAHAGIQDITSCRTGLISATSLGGMDMTEKYFYSALETGEGKNYIESHPAGTSAQHIAEALGIEEGFVTTISTACSSSANAIMYGARLIKAGMLDRVIVGGADCLSKFTMNGFNSLMILSDEENTPFDEHRKGLNLGEGAAFLVIESEEQVKKENKKVLAYLSGYGNTNDAHHQTASSEYGDGATSAMIKALEVAEMNASDIDYINAHGTATGNNDLSEGRAIIRVFGEKVPDFSSTKAFTGHTLAAAGSIEAVFAILSLQNGQIFPNLNFKTPMKEFDLIPVTTLMEKPLKRILSNSFGFGGNCSSLIFSKNPS